MLKSFRNDRSVAKFDAIFKLPNLRTIAIHLQQWDSKTLRSFTHKIRLRIFSMYPRNKSAVCTKNASRRRIHREFSANSRTIRLRLFPCIRTIRRHMNAHEQKTSLRNLSIALELVKKFYGICWHFIRLIFHPKKFCDFSSEFSNSFT